MLVLAGADVPADEEEDLELEATDTVVEEVVDEVVVDMEGTKGMGV